MGSPNTTYLSMDNVGSRQTRVFCNLMYFFNSMHYPLYCSHTIAYCTCWNLEAIQQLWTQGRPICNTWFIDDALQYLINNLCLQISRPPCIFFYSLILWADRKSIRHSFVCCCILVFIIYNCLCLSELSPPTRK